MANLRKNSSVDDATKDVPDSSHDEEGNNEFPNWIISMQLPSQNIACSCFCTQFKIVYSFLNIL